MKIELRHEVLQLLHDQWGLLGEELREIWDGIQAVDEDLAQMFTGNMQSAYRATVERSSAQTSQLSNIFESLFVQLDEANHMAEAFDRALGTMIQRGRRKVRAVVVAIFATVSEICACCKEHCEIIDNQGSASVHLRRTDMWEMSRTKEHIRSKRTCGHGCDKKRKNSLRGYWRRSRDINAVWKIVFGRQETIL